MLKTKVELIKFIQNDKCMMDALFAAKTLGLPNWFIGAGFVRNIVWNHQHGFKEDYIIKDIDLAYFDPKNVNERLDIINSKKLRKIFDANWEIVNQAYAHKYNNVKPYKSAIDGLAHWVETATSVGVTLDKNDNLKIFAPWGIKDLLNLKLRLIPIFVGDVYYEKIFKERIKSKKWLKKWPKLEIVS